MKFNGINYFRGGAEEVDLGDYGEKREPVFGANYLSVYKNIPFKKLKINDVTEVFINFKTTTESDITAGFMKNVIGASGGNLYKRGPKAAPAEVLRRHGRHGRRVQQFPEGFGLDDPGGQRRSRCPSDLRCRDVGVFRNDDVGDQFRRQRVQRQHQPTAKGFQEGRQEGHRFGARDDLQLSSDEAQVEQFPKEQTDRSSVPPPISGACLRPSAWCRRSGGSIYLGYRPFMSMPRMSEEGEGETGRSPGRSDLRGWCYVWVSIRPSVFRPVRHRRHREHVLPLLQRVPLLAGSVLPSRRPGCTTG